jgi:serine/threonine-protein kinase
MDPNPAPPTIPAAVQPPPARADEDWTGRMLGEFHIIRSLGVGGMGQVYLAEQTTLKRKVALKMLRPELAANPTALTRFRSEAEAVAKITHANIVQIYDVREQDGVHFMALEYVEGRNLRDYLAKKGPPELPVCLHIMTQVANALQRAHKAGFIHRDVKPENILLTRKAEAKVTDFGLTRALASDGPPVDLTHQPLSLTQTGVVMGTPLYMSPEQVQGKPVDHRTDIYSYGVTCFALLAGTTPFRGATAFEVALQHVQAEPPALTGIRPDLPPELCAMVHKMMAKDPAQRYQNFKQIVRELTQLKESKALGMPGPTLNLPPSGTMAAPSTGSLNLGINEEPTGPLRWLQSKWFKPVVAALLVGLFLGGATARVVRHRLDAKEATPNTPAPLTEKPTISEEEAYLRQSVKFHADPSPSDDRKMKDGLEAQIELGVYLLQRRRFDEADEFFKDLTERRYKPMSAKGTEHPYRVFARLGQALIKAFRDQNVALDELGKLIQLKFPNAAAVPINVTVGGVPGTMFDNPDLRKLLVEALNRLALDLKVEKFDKYPALDALRKPGSLRVRPKS